jgi:DNA-directed RNA polymerase specialized sigma24 family protein
MSPKEMDRKSVIEAIRRVLSGHENDYAVVHESCDRPLRAYIASHYYWAGPDFENEVAVRTHEYALSRLSEYDATKSSPLTWLCWLSRSVASQVVRECYGSRLVQYDEAVHEAWAATVAGPAEIYEERRLNRVLGQEKSLLPEDGRKSVELHDEADLTFAESAEASGLSVMQVRYRRRRALDVLKRRLQKREVRPVVVDFTPAPVWHGRDWTNPDDFCAPTVAVLPDGPDTLVGAATAEEKEESAE